MLDKESVFLAGTASALMAFSRWYLEMREGKPFRPFFFAVDLFISMGMGYFAFLCASELGYPQGACSMAAGLAGAIGTKSVDIIQFWARSKVHMEEINDGERNQKQ